MNIRLFDTILNINKKNTTDRNYQEIWNAYTKLKGWKFFYERMHSLSDANFFLSKTISEDVIIFSGHGGRSPSFILSNGESLMPEDLEMIDIKKTTENKFIIFAACGIGKDLKLLKKYKDALKAKRIFSYKHEISDEYCFLFESILMEFISRNLEFNEKHFDEYREATFFLKNINARNVKTHPMVMI
ncbi:MAG: hypothetical protein ACTJHW_05255 [Paenalcaligenes sp.]